MEIYEYLIYNKDNKYKKEFDTRWMKFMNDLNLPYTESLILHMGNRFRPKLVYFGYLFSNNTVLTDFSRIADIGICVETLHKASLIIDDIIDNDNKRYGQCVFHKQFSVNEAIAFSVHLIGKSYKLLNETFYSNVYDNKIIMYALGLYSNTISEMTYGALMEMQKMGNSIATVRDIAYFETATLIKNSLILGYLMGNNIDDEVIKIFSKLGEKCGELYQLLNDLEPFLNPQFNIQHKGKVNLDFNNYRKNMVVTFISSILGDEIMDRATFENEGAWQQYIYELMHNRRIKNVIWTEIKSYYEEITDYMAWLEHYSENTEWHRSFLKFFEETFKWGIIRTRL